MPRLRTVLFLCTGNSCRSQMAEALLRHLGGDCFAAFSAGTDPADQVHPLAVETMRERGIDLAGQRPRSLDEFAGRTFDLLVTTCDDAREACPFFAGARERLHWSLPDPAKAVGSEAEVRAAFRRVAAELATRIEELVR